jgi:hypothetical protein
VPLQLSCEEEPWCSTDGLPRLPAAMCLRGSSSIGPWLKTSEQDRALKPAPQNWVNDRYGDDADILCCECSTKSSPQPLGFAPPLRRHKGMLRSRDAMNSCREAQRHPQLQLRLRGEPRVGRRRSTSPAASAAVLRCSATTASPAATSPAGPSPATRSATVGKTDAPYRRKRCCPLQACRFHTRWWSAPP